MKNNANRQMIKVNQLREADYNPPNRTAEVKTKDLEESMRLIGMLHPITVTPDKQVIDGHRRLSVAKRLGWKEIECNVLDLPPEQVYASINTTPRRMSGNDALGVYLKNPNAVNEKQRKCFERMVSVIGEDLSQKIYNSGCSQRVYSTAVQIARYCDDRADETIQAIVNWLLEFAAIGQVMKALEAGVDGRKILKAVAMGKPVVLRLDVA